MLNRQTLIPESHTQRGSNQTTQSILCMPKIVEEQTVSTHSDMNTTEFLSHYMHGGDTREPSEVGLSGQKCTNPALLPLASKCCQGNPQAHHKKNKSSITVYEPTLL